MSEATLKDNASAATATAAHPAATASSSLDISIKFGKRVLCLALSQEETVGGLKATLEDLTCVDAKRQKLVGIPKADDGCRLSELSLKRHLMLVGTPSSELEKAARDEAAGLSAAQEIEDDFASLGEDSNGTSLTFRWRPRLS